MQLNPRYGADPVITLDGPPGAICEPTVRQRRRLVAALGSFDEQQWGRPSRCDGWSGRDVIVHLDSTNRFWSHSIAAGLRGEPTQLLATFDPVESPAELVAGASDLSANEVLESFVASTESFTSLLASIDDDGWSALAEAPPGHLSVSAVAHHALWDSWVHERDILLPQGVTPDEEADEVAACLRYAAALGAAIAVNGGSTDEGRLAIAVSDPDLSIVVEVGDRVAVGAGPAAGDAGLSGDAVELVEALSLRRPLDQPVPAGASWLAGGLADAFDLGRD